MLNRHPLSWPRRACPEAPLPREQETLKPYVPRGNNGIRKKRIGGKKQGFLRRKSEAASNVPAATAGAPSRTAPSEEGITHLRQTLPTRDSPARFPAGSSGFSWFSFHWIQLTREPTGKISSLPVTSACQDPGEAPLPWCGGRSEVRLLPSPPARAGAFPSWVASEQTCCCSWRRSRAAPECRCYPSLSPRAGSGLWPHTDPGRWLISSQMEVKGCQSQGAAPRQQGEKKPAARLAALGDI